MAKLLKPALFSAHTGVAGIHFDKAGLIDPILNCDTKLFVDPLLVGSSSHKGVKADGYKLLKERSDLDAFINQNRRSSTGDAGGVT